MDLNTINDIYLHFSDLMKSSDESLIVETMVESKFSSLERDSDRVKLVTDILKHYDLLPNEKVLKNKSLEKSLELRNAGNKSFVKKDDKTALALYTKSIAAAPFPTEVDDANSALAIGFANRSAVLFSVGKYELCLRDISEALKYNYPKKLLYKLYDRQGRCLKHLGRKKEAQKSLNNALKWLSSATELTQDKKQAIEAELQKLMKCSQNEKNSVKQSSYKLPELPTCSYGKNHEFPCASDCVELKYSPEMGRYFSATRNIMPGDVIAVEKPFASALSPENFETHCYNCLKSCEALLPCCFCSNVMYCSEECRSSCWNKTHFIACSLLPTFQKLELNKRDFLVLKIVIMACKTGDLKNTLDKLKAEENIEERNKGFNSENSYISSDYSPIYWLVRYTEKRSIPDLLQRSIKAAVILHCLETMSDFFSGIDIDQFKYEVGGLLLRHLQNIPLNNHGVFDNLIINKRDSEEISSYEKYKTVAVQDYDVFKAKREGEVGVGVYAMLSLLNHSCDANVVRNNYRGDIIVLHAIRSIQAGDQVFDCYGPCYGKHEKEQRRSYFEKSYFFTCKCEPCVEDWPRYTVSLQNEPPTYLCNRCKHTLPVIETISMGRESATCNNCGKTTNVLETMTKLVSSGAENQCYIKQMVAQEDGTDYNELAQNLIKHLLFLEENIKRPNVHYFACQECIKKCYALSAMYCE